MMFGNLVDNLGDFRQSVSRCVLLYSGGLDSTYFLWWARKHNIPTIALHIHLGPGTIDNDLSRIATQLGAEYRVRDLTDVFVSRYIAPAICANALYQDQFPICSSLSRPLMAAEAVKVATAEEIDCIVHTSTFTQNSAARFNISLRTLAPHVTIGNPFIRESIERERKLEVLRTAGVKLKGNIYSIDENIWGRVIECGELDDPAYPIPEHVFLRTRNATEAPRTSLDVTLGFEAGIPVRLNGEALTLRDIIAQLNDLGGRYGIGRYNGLEDTPLGVKNHEVREAPAAAAILLAHAALERAVLTQHEVRTKKSIDAEWTNLVVNGGWFTSLKNAIEAFGVVLNQYVSGEIILQYAPGNVFMRAVHVVHGPHYWNLRNVVEPWIETFSYREFFELSTVTERLRSMRTVKS